MTRKIPSSRLRTLGNAPVNKDGEYIVYWMVGARRPHYNFALQHAVARAKEHNVGLIIFEPLRVDYPWASDRHHHAVIAGMRDNREAFERGAAQYYPYVEPKQGAGRGLLVALAKRACLVVTDDTPGFFQPRMQQAASEKIAVTLEVVDGNGMYPIRETERVFTTAASFRRHLQKELPEHLACSPLKNPLAGVSLRQPPALDAKLRKRWPQATLKANESLGDLPIDHTVAPVAMPSGPKAAKKALKHFLSTNYPNYVEKRNQPEAECQSYLSPHLHFGHISSHEIFLELMKQDDWTPQRLAEKANGSRNGWWGASEATEAFLDQFITWREIGFNMASLHPRFREFDSLPGWAQKTLEDHESDVREFQYNFETFEFSQTHDPLWNAAQTQLRTEGIMHNYLRMLWGKKILEWSPTPRAALSVMLELNNKYALDGRDPNSYSGIFWTLGRYDRAWGPERPIFGKIRYMSSDNTARKVRVRNYIKRYNDV
jgi:deoxyribodipyrimidine photo-lyase